MGTAIARQLGAGRTVLLADNNDAAQLDLLSPQTITDLGIAYSTTKQANHIRVYAASAYRGRQGTRINSISPGVVATPMGRQELASPGW
ncbi:hypothetical protein [Mycobacterium haemophilum]